jgi:hypothetical protein
MNSSQLETLTAEYDAVLLKYNKALADNIDFQVLPGQTYMNTVLSEGAATSVDECKAMCSSDKQCTGATFNSDDQYCRTTSGEGSPTVSSDSDYAILENKHTLTSLNKRLLDINQEIVQLMKTLEPIPKLDITQIMEINELIPNTDNSEIVMRYNKYWYLLFVVGVIGILLILFKLSFNSNQSGEMNVEMSGGFKGFEDFQGTINKILTMPIVIMFLASIVAYYLSNYMLF